MSACVSWSSRQNLTLHTLYVLGYAIVRRIRATIVEVEKKQVLYILSVCVCSLSYQACKVHALHCMVICGPFCCQFFHIISQTSLFSEKKKLLNI
jgi:hypothetical protein